MSMQAWPRLSAYAFVFLASAKANALVMSPRPVILGATQWGSIISRIYICAEVVFYT